MSTTKLIQMHPILTNTVLGIILAAISDIREERSNRNVVTKKAKVTMKNSVCSEFPEKPCFVVL